MADDSSNFTTSGTSFPSDSQLRVELDSAPRIAGQSGTAGDPRIGSRCGRYLLSGILGRGGMGVVYEAQDPDTGRPVAVKLLPAALSGDREAVQRFLLEVKAAGKVNHPNAIGILDAGREGESHYMAMELVRGGSAKEYLEARGAFQWPEATRVILDTCRGLAAAHAAGLIHRDIKPANIMRSNEGVVKLADFGLAKAGDQSQTSLTGKGEVVGTPAYMSPEQCQAEKLDVRSDIYSLGATYYALLTGSPPFANAGSPMQVMYAHCNRPPPDPREARPEIPERCAKIVLRAMAKDPAARYPTAEAMLAALEKALPGNAGTDEDPTSGWNEFLSSRRLAILDTPPPGALAMAAPPAANPQSTKAAAPAPTPASAPAPAPAPAQARGSAAGLPRGSRTTRIARAPKQTPMIVAATAAAILLAGGLAFIGSRLLGGSGAAPAPKPDRSDPVAKTDPPDEPVTPSHTGPTPTDPPKDPPRDPVVKAVTPAADDDPAYSGPWRPLFNGKDFTDWLVNRPAQVAVAEIDGGPVIRISGEAGDGADVALTSRYEFADYHLRLEYRWAGGGGNQGVFYHVADKLRCEFEICTTTPRSITGSWVARSGLFLGAFRAAERPVGQWNQVDILCRGSAVRHVLNDELVVALNETPGGGEGRLPSAGRIGLQLQTGDILFRNIRLRPITALPARYAGVPARTRPLDPPPDVWERLAAAVPADKRMPVILERMMAVNPGYNGDAAFRTTPDGGRELLLCTNDVADLSPLRAATDLRVLLARGDSGKGRLGDLSPLAKTAVERLDIRGNPAADLAGLKGGPLKELWCDFVPGRHEATLRGIPALLAINGKPAAAVLGAATPVPPKSGDNPPPSKEAIDLLPLIDPAADAVRGTFKRNDAGGLTISRDYNARVEVPYEPPDEYDLHAEFTLTAGGDAVVLLLSRGGRAFEWVVGSAANSVSGFQIVAGKSVGDSPGTVRKPGLLQVNKRHVLVAEVRRDGLRGTLDGEEVAALKTDGSDLAPTQVWSLKDPKRIGFGTQVRPAVLHALSVREVSGKGRFSRPDDPAAKAADAKRAARPSQ